MQRKILVDRGIPDAQLLYSPLGELIFIDGADISPKTEVLSEIDIMIIRSITKVKPELLSAAPRLKVIGSTAAGTDHIDLEDARQRRIKVLSAGGSNSAAVAEYVVHNLLYLGTLDSVSLSSRTIGIIGYGNIGRKVDEMLRSLGASTSVYSPDILGLGRIPNEVTLNELLLKSDVITVHAALTRTSGMPEAKGTMVDSHPSYHLIGQREFEMMRRLPYLINTSRGELVGTELLKKAHHERQIRGMVLDVYENEPHPDASLVQDAVIATPHIAGHAIEAKRRGAVMVAEQLHEKLGIQFGLDRRALVYGNANASNQRQVYFNPVGDNEIDADSAVYALLKAIHNIEAVSLEFKRAMLEENTELRAANFTRLRNTYQDRYRRRELTGYKVALDLSSHLKPEVSTRLQGLGIQIVEKPGAHYVLASQ